MLSSVVVLILAQAFDAQTMGLGFGYADSVRCQPCHPRHFKEWISSVHAASERRLVMPHGSFRQPTPAGDDLQDPLCVPCHGQDISSLLGMRATDHHVNLAHAAERGITCTLCHQIPVESIGEVQRMDSGRKIYDSRPLGERRGRPFHPGAKAVEKLRTGEFCGPCHEVTAPNGIRLERTFSQFLESPYPSRKEDCATCHLNTYGGAMVPDGIHHPELHRHDVIGVDVATNPVPAAGSQFDRVELFLQAAATMFVKEPAAVVAGKSFELAVEVVNSGTGHNLPSGFPVERRLWLEVDVTLADGTPIFRSGLSERDELESLESRRRSDPQLVSFTDRLRDPAGKEVPFWWQAARLEENSIRAHERRLSSYEIEVPESAMGKDLRIGVRLRFQACSPRQLREFGITSLLDDYPIFDLDVYRSPPIPVRERLFPESTIVVPDHVTTIEEAFNKARSDDTILVRPGTYLFDSELRFNGKELMLRSLEGPDVTILGRREGIGPGSVLVFDAGEGPATRVEGFTITGGRGTVVGGEAHGGGVFCANSSPTIVGNHFVENRVDGSGGGAYFLNAAAVLEHNVFTRNSAGLNGGGIAIAGDSKLSISGGEFVGNVAGGHGGGLMSTAAVSISRVVFRGNQAYRGGGLAFGMAGISSVLGGGINALVDECQLIGNAAPLGGGLAIEDMSARFEKTLIAGNIARLAGGLYLQGQLGPEFNNVTITENKAVKWGAIRCRDDGRPSFRNSILWGNTPPELVGEMSYSLIDDENLADDTNKAGLPLFLRSPGAWEPCEDIDDPGCVPVRWSPGRPPTPIAYARWVPGIYEIIGKSIAVDAGSLDDSPDPDDSPRDLGAFYRQQPLRGFVRGDVDGNGVHDIEDVLTLFRHLLNGDRLRCADAADINDRSGVDPIDLLHLLLHYFNVGIEPAAPYPGCGIDPTPGDGVGCFEDHVGCR